MTTRRLTTSGILLLAAGAVAVISGFPAKTKDRSQPDYVLAISWQPAFCETPAGEGKPECVSQHESRRDADHFSLHGLWPRDQYCGIDDRQRNLDRSGRWHELDAVVLERDLELELRTVMPGTQSGLHLHEWVKHGSCHGGTAQEYYAESLSLMRAVNGSPLRDLFAGNIGREVSASQIVEAADAAFGAAAGQRIRISCYRDEDRLLIREITIGLSGDLSAESDIAGLIANAPPTERGCPGGVVDPVGDQ